MEMHSLMANYRIGVLTMQVLSLCVILCTAECRYRMVWFSFAATHKFDRQLDIVYFIPVLAANFFSFFFFYITRVLVNFTVLYCTA